MQKNRAAKTSVSLSILCLDENVFRIARFIMKMLSGTEVFDAPLRWCKNRASKTSVSLAIFMLSLCKAKLSIEDFRAIESHAFLLPLFKNPASKTCMPLGNFALSLRNKEIEHRRLPCH